MVSRSTWFLSYWLFVQPKVCQVDNTISSGQISIHNVDVQNRREWHCFVLSHHLFTSGFPAILFSRQTTRINQPPRCYGNMYNSSWLGYHPPLSVFRLNKSSLTGQSMLLSHMFNLIICTRGTGQTAGSLDFVYLT